MIILHCIDVKNSKGNGVSVSTYNWFKYQSKENKVAIYSMSDSSIFECDNLFLFKDYKKIKFLPEPYNKPDLVIFNEVYKVKFIKLYKECKKMGVKYIVVPHGCLIRESQEHKKLKKLIGNILLFNKFISSSDAVQFLSESEEKNSIFNYTKSIIVPNCVEMKNIVNKPTNKNIVFIGRYDINIKGLDLLVSTIKAYKDWFISQKIKVCLYGLGEDEELLKLKKLIVTGNVEDIININGPVYGDDKERILENAYLFIQTSRHEGQPMGILEALSFGLPCVVTYGTKFGELVNDFKCGKGVDFDKTEVFNAIKYFYANPYVREEYSVNAKKVIETEFNSEKSISKMMKEYEEIIGG